MNLNSIESTIEKQFQYYNFDESLETESIFKKIYECLLSKKKLHGIEYSYLCWLNYRFGWELKINVPKIPLIKQINIISFKTEFLFNDLRKLLFKELEEFVKIKKEKNNIDGNVIIGGSFIDIENKTPKDIDVIFLIPYEFLNKGEFNDTEEFATEAFNNKRSQNLDLVYLPSNYNLNKFRAYTYITAYGNKAKMSEKNSPSVGIENNKFNEIELIKIVI